MSSTTFKMSAIAVSILAATQVQAALYQVVAVSPNFKANEYYGRAIQKDTVSSYPLGCFTSGSSCNSFALGGDTLNGSDGISYRDEVPFKMDNRFLYQDRDDLEDYCYRELGYSTCDAWADKQWHGFDYTDPDTNTTSQVGGLKRERDAWDNANYTSNASAFVNTAQKLPTINAIVGSSDPIAGTINTTITAIDGSTPIGITSSGYALSGSNYALGYRQRGFYGQTILNPPTDTSIVSDTNNKIVEKMGRTFAYDVFADSPNKFVVGSASVSPYLTGNSDDDNKDYNGDVSDCVNDSVDPQTTRQCQNFAFATQAYMWDATSPTVGYRVTGWVGDVTANRNGYSAEASVRGAAIADSGNYATKPVMAGFNTSRDSDVLRMQATVFYPNGKYDPANPVHDMWDSKVISGTELKQGSDLIYSNSMATDINKNLIVVGESKRRGDRPESGAAANRIFIADANTGNPVANYLSGGIFFSGADGEANAINKYNEVVGTIDAETSREYNGKQRRHRGFIYPYNGTGSEATRMALFKNQAWWLDDLTNDGNAKGANNKYRIFEASDINDDGVIAATAFKCSGGYDDTSHNSYCSSGTEAVVAIKLLPIAGSTADDIVVRNTDLPDVERKGGSLGWLTLTLIGLLGFRRK
ncbi:conserved exported hypothetical protein [Vibrio aestuarianus]|uniref:GlyGly-CTERM sorting domain-containing protein n=1 Tax=Vibrio aestuarianus TaxID=28171 RepID=A0ABM9FQ98_9VIBR|nr:DUF3466 family protein [Vibrio aestuarianus]NLS58038.1 DUF3466 family protein [Vibrio aestuarianus subsp. francensis]CAH8192680.1 conserved exported hypothetical protein [Vibrio aestuarianus]CAH8228857.1 conserved exported hypothetical protein [Vibrio aestuarianus]